MNRTILSILLSTAFFLPPALAVADEDASEYTLDGLKLIDKNRRGEVYADPDLDWAEYSEIILDRPTVSFRKYWQRDQNRSRTNRVKTEDMERIKSELADLFEEVFTEELTSKGGYTVAEASGENVMRITPHIIDLDVSAPDIRQTNMTRNYTEQAGEMTLKLAIFDSVTGDLVATLQNRQAAPRRGYMQWTTSASNRAEARLMLQKWAKDLGERLAEARADPSDG